MSNIPIQIPTTSGNENQETVPPNDVIVLYRDESLRNVPGHIATESGFLDHCDNLQVMSTSPSITGTRTCLAVMELKESSHVMHFQQSRRGWKVRSRFLPDVPLANPPKPVSTQAIERWLGSYFSLHHDKLTSKLKRIASRVVANGQHLVVMVCNADHSELLLNFACASRKLGIDLKEYLIFAMDESTKQSAEGWGFQVFYDPEFGYETPAFGEIEYGTMDYAKMMMSKVQCAYMISSLGHDFVFMDVDIVPYRFDFLDHFLSFSKGYDMVFQYDHSKEPIYQPWSANSGFYFVRNNQRTKNFLALLMRSGDMILRSKSHQAVLNILLSEHVSLFGMKVRILDDASSDFPGMYYLFPLCELL